MRPCSLPHGLPPLPRPGLIASLTSSAPRPCALQKRRWASLALWRLRARARARPPCSPPPKSLATAAPSPTAPPAPPLSMPTAPRPPPQALGRDETYRALPSIVAVVQAASLGCRGQVATSCCGPNSGIGAVVVGHCESMSPLCGRRCPSPAGRIGHRPVPTCPLLGSV